jgi:hypothetical protein
MLIPLAIDCIIKNTENYEILIWSGTLTSKKQLATSGELPISSSGHVSRYWYIAECIPNFRASYEHVLTTPLPDPPFGSAPTTGFPLSSGFSLTDKLKPPDTTVKSYIVHSLNFL